MAAETTASEHETHASADQCTFRKRLFEMFEDNPIPSGDQIANLGLFIRGSLLVKFLVINELYRRIQPIPGIIAEFGTWWGQNLVLFENLRAIYEPFNKGRRIIGFDTFEGYQNISDKDAPDDQVFREGGYATGATYQEFLAELLEVHEGNNVLGHLRGNHQLVAGDVTVTAPRFFEENQQLTVALGYFDLGLYNPTKAALTAIKPHLVPGSLLLLDEFSLPNAPGEARAFRETFAPGEYRLEICPFTPLRTIVTIL